MWSYMILFSELYLDFPLFPPEPKGGIIANFFQVLSPLPESWKGLGRLRDSEDSGNIRIHGLDPVQNGELKRRIASRRPDVDQEERNLVKPSCGKFWSTPQRGV
ncbi:hypothetical protein N7540_000213 [Penicillium herquei]|nr:hypothetical protein N7540_000213 [Penicillium herquei]